MIGIGQSESKGLRKGVVINLEATVDAIKRVLEEAELMAGVEIDSVYVGIAGTHIKGFNSRGVIAVYSKNRTIDREDVKRVIEAAKATMIARSSAFTTFPVRDPSGAQLRASSRAWVRKPVWATIRWSGRTAWPSMCQPRWKTSSVRASIHCRRSASRACVAWVIDGV